MGLNLFFRSYSRDSVQYVPNNQPMPDPDNWKIVAYFEFGNHLLIKIRYPDCTNYEGNKILLYKNTTLNELKNQKHVDPHFSDNKKFKSPVARFEPTDRGWEYGLDLIKYLDNCDR